MHRLIKGVIALSLGSILLAGCSFGDDANDTAGRIYTHFYDAAQEALPSYGTASTASISASATWQLGKPIYELYGVLENDDQVNVGYFNLWDLIEDADQRFSEMMTNGEEIELATIVAPQMRVMTEAATYNRYQNYTEGSTSGQTFAMESGSELRLVATYSMGTTQRGVTHGRYDSATGDLRIEMLLANYVDEQDAVGWEVVRVYAEGNTITHVFTMKIIRDGAVYDHNIVGAGVSQGTEGYFLLHLEDNESVTAARFYNIGADATVADLQSLDDAGFASAADAGDADGHEADLPTRFATSDLPANPGTMDLSIAEPTVIVAE